MRQLTPLDAQFLSLESATTTAHVGTVSIFDASSAPPGAVTRKSLVALLRERLPLAPPLRMRLADVPLWLDRPYWVDAEDFDPADHVHEAELPAPGDDHQLAAYVAGVHARRLDRSRPLWEAHLIHGLSGDRVALYTKIHHCAIDGVTGSEILAAVLDPSPDPRLVEPPPPVEPERGPGLVGMLAGAVARSALQPVETLCSLGRTLGDLDTLPVLSTLPDARRIARAARALAGDTRAVPVTPPLVVPRTPFNGRITGTRAVSFGSVPMGEVRRVARVFGMSPNDVVMTLCASVLRRWLLAHGALPDRPLVAAVPVALRTAGGDLGNRISAMVMPLATEVADPAERLAAVRSAMAAAKRRFVLSKRSWLNDVCAMFPAAFAKLATPIVFRMLGVAGTGVNVIISHVPGPRRPLYLCGARMLACHPLSVVTDATGGLSITCISYDGRLDFGFVVCPDLVPDVWSLTGHLGDALDELLRLAGETDRPEGTAPEEDKVPA